MREDSPCARQLGDGFEDADKFRFSVAERDRQRRYAHTGFCGRYKSKNTVAARRVLGIRSNFAQPRGQTVAREAFIERNQRMVLQVLDRCRGPIALQIRAACVGRPDRVGDLTANQFTLRVPGPKGNVGFTFRQVDVTVCEHELKPEVGMTSMETVNEPRLYQAYGNRLRTGQAQDTGVRGLVRLLDELFDGSG